jgi:hypothetical protein
LSFSERAVIEDISSLSIIFAVSIVGSVPCSFFKFYYRMFCCLLYTGNVPIIPWRTRGRSRQTTHLEWVRVKAWVLQQFFTTQYPQRPKRETPWRPDNPKKESCSYARETCAGVLWQREFSGSS